MALCGTIKHHNKNEKPCVLGFWHFLTSERIAGLSASLSAKESCKSKDLRDFLFLCFGSPPFGGIKNFCLTLYKVVSYQLNFGIKQINSLPSAEFILPTRHDSPHSYTFSLFHGDNSN